MRIQVLVATMHQTDHSLLEKMNIQTDAIIINQCDRNDYEEFSYNGHTIRFISTIQRGLSRSRNMALSYADGDICLIADDDIRYVDGYESIVRNAFEKEPRADIIAFNAYMINDSSKRQRRIIEQNKEVAKHRYYSSVRLGFRLNKIQKIGLRFNELFGAGAPYCMGEESLLLREARKKGLRFFQNVAYVSEVDCSSSTWFQGCDANYYFNKGVFLGAAYGNTAWLFKWYFILQSRNETDIGFKNVYRNLKKGISFYKNL